MNNILNYLLTDWADTLFIMVLFGVLGLGLEIIFTAVLDAKKDHQRHLWGYSSLWYLPLYMMAPIVLELSADMISPLPFLARGLIYMIAIFSCEFVAMYALRKLLGASPSEANYKLSRWNICGLIRLDYAPAMFLMGLRFEFVYQQIGW